MVLNPPGADADVSDPRFEPEPLGPHHEVFARVHEALPDLKAHDPGWWTLARPRDGIFVEFLLSDRDPVTSFGMKVDGTDAAFDVVVDLLESLGWQGQDIAAGLPVTREGSRASFRVAAAG